jgi:hypothetical protein
MRSGIHPLNSLAASQPAVLSAEKDDNVQE